MNNETKQILKNYYSAYLHANGKFKADYLKFKNIKNGWLILETDLCKDKERISNLIWMADNLWRR